MIKEIRLREEAEVDLSEAAIWYQQQQSGLGDEFLDEHAAIAKTGLGFGDTGGQRLADIGALFD